MGLGNVVVKEIQAAKQLSGAGTTTGTGVDMSATINIMGREIVGFLSVGAKSGTSPTLDVKYQESSDDSTYTDISGAAFTQATDVTNETIRFRLTKKYLRESRTVGGSSPTFT